MSISSLDKPDSITQKPLPGKGLMRAALVTALSIASPAIMPNEAMAQQAVTATTSAPNLKQLIASGAITTQTEVNKFLDAQWKKFVEEAKSETDKKIHEIENMNIRESSKEVLKKVWLNKTDQIAHEKMDKYLKENRLP